MEFNLQDVVSSQIAQVGHNAEVNKMRVVFKNGGVYDYSNVSKGVFDAIITSDSVGSAFSRGIKSNPTAFPFVKV